ncbi:type II toxin-antitoxin system MqsA family antitoxin [Pseudomonas sihuiensis]
MFAAARIRCGKSVICRLPTGSRQRLSPKVKADWCNACGEALTGPEQSERVMAAMKRFRQQVEAG